MNRITFPLKQAVTGAAVVDLQQALIALGYTIAAAEQKNQRYGVTTKAAVAMFQTDHGLPAQGAVDQATADAINGAATQTAPLPASTPPEPTQPPGPAPGQIPPPGDVPLPAPQEPVTYSAAGEVVEADGTPVVSLWVRAFDRALCNWRPLGEARTENGGQYRIVYDAAQLKAWGKTRADLKVEVYDPTGDTLLASSPVILQARPQEIVNFAVGDQAYRGPDEYTRVERALAPLLQSRDDLSCLEIADVLILAREAKLAQSNVAYYVKARRWSAQLNAPAPLFYGLLRRGQPTRLDALLARPLSALWRELQAARGQNLIKQPLNNVLRSSLGELQKTYLAQPTHPYSQLLKTTALDAGQQAAFTQKLIAGEQSGDAFWQSLSKNDGFSSQLVTELQTTFALQAFSADNTSLTVHLRSKKQVSSPRQVAAYSMETWRDSVLTDSTVEIPDDILPSAAEADRRAAYAHLLYRSAEQRYPTASLAGQMQRSTPWQQSPALGFLSAFPDFEFSETRVLGFLKQNPNALGTFSDPQSAKNDLLRTEQLFHLTPSEDKLAVIQPLWDAGLRSAPQISMLGRQHLLRRVPGLAKKTATDIYRQALHVTSVALNVYARYHPRLNSLSTAVVQLPQLPAAQSLGKAAAALPEWEELFGSADACECSHCESALSPAAYLVDMMAFLQRAEDSNGNNALDDLLTRRPDLGTLQLTCANTETELPQIDLVIEILEAITASADGQTLDGNAIGPTTLDSEQLAAQSEYSNSAAYEIVRNAVYPFDRLPFDLWAEETRRCLDQMGIARNELMRALPPKPGVGALQIGTETLGMTGKERDIICNPATKADELAIAWGLPVAKLGKVETLMKQANIDYDTLLRPLNTRYVNPDRGIVVVFAAATPCSLTGAVLGNADGSALTNAVLRKFLDRLHRYLRLQRRLGWTEYELDALLSALAVADFNAKDFLTHLADAVSLSRQPGVSMTELCSWWGNLETYAFEDELPSTYETIFLNPSLFPPSYSGNGPDLRNKVFALRTDRADLAITTSTDATLSRWLATSDGATPPAYTLQADYAAYIQSATRLTSADLEVLVEEVLPKDSTTGHIPLDLATVSLLYRIGSLARAMTCSVPDYLLLTRITGLSPLSGPGDAKTPSDSMNFYRAWLEIGQGGFSLAQLAYLLLHGSGAATALAPIQADMDAWLDVMSPGFSGILDVTVASSNAELIGAVTQSLASALAVDAAILDALLFTHRPASGTDVLAHLIVNGNAGAPGLPVPSEDFHAVFERLFKFALAWNGLNLDASFLAFVLDQGPALGWTDVAALPLLEQTTADYQPWRRLTDAVDLQRSLFTTELSLFGLLETAKAVDPSLFVVDDFLAQVSESSAWPMTDLSYLVGPNGFNLTLPQAMQDERSFVTLRLAFDVFRRAGISVEQAHGWTVAEPGYAEAQSARQALSLSYPADRWLDVLATLQDQLRPLKRDALLGHLLHTLGFDDSTEFYHHYLIDPEQSPCAKTSRIVEAHAAVQIFAQRILLNLEPFAFSREDAEAMAWRKRYRVWEAARKIFLYPENWLYPEVRDNKSAFFQELEDGLLQDDVNLDTAERLYRDYLYKLDQVSRLEIMGMYDDDRDDDTSTLHVFGRTKDVPHTYLYRRWEDKARWTPWERVDLDIQSDHLIPVVYNGRLYLFWPDFTIQQNTPNITDVESEIEKLQDLIDKTTESINDWPSSLGESPLIPYLDYLKEQMDTKLLEKQNVIDETIPYTIELSLAWSTYLDTKWETKKISNKTTYSAEFTEYKHYFLASINTANQLSIQAYIRSGDFSFLDLFGGLFGTEEESIVDAKVATFTLDSCHDEILVDNVLSSTAAMDEVFIPNEIAVFNYLRYFNIASKLEIQVSREQRTLLRSANLYNYYYCHQYGIGGKETSPFFFADDKRSYFVEPLEGVPAVSDLLVTTSQTTKAASIARTAVATGSGHPAIAPTTHYQGTNSGLFVDHTLADVTLGTTVTSAGSLGTILDTDPPPVIVAGEPLLNTGFRYRFTRFYHPYTCLFLKQLARFGIDGLLNPDPDWGDDSENLYRQLTPLESFDFKTTYDPNFDWVHQSLSTTQTETLDEKIDFDHWSAYGSYNWELFFHIPFLIATRLTQNQRYAEARQWFHYIFDPTCTAGTGSERFWKIKPFYEEQKGGSLETLQDLITQGSTELEQQIEEWEDEPFQPHVVARLRITAYMQATVMRYLDCLIAEADMLFTRFTREDLNEAAQLYLLANEILGDRPMVLPAQEPAMLTPNLLLGRFKLILGNGLPFDPLDQLSAWLPSKLTGVPGSRAAMPDFSSTSIPTQTFGQLIPAGTGAVPAGGGSATLDTLLLCCLPQNDMLYGYWDTVADRLFKIRHCMNIEGQVRTLPLFAPPIDPALLVRAAAAGLDIASIVGGLYAPLPNYRFSFMLQKALEICGEVRNLGAGMLAALEKRDGEEISLLRSTHELTLLRAIRQIKNKGIDEASESLFALQKSRESAEFRRDFYQSRAIIAEETKQLDELIKAQGIQQKSQGINALASTLYLIPDIQAGVMVSSFFGGTYLGNAQNAFGQAMGYFSAQHSNKATLSDISGNRKRRQDDWNFQADLAEKEIEQFDKQILAAEIRQQIAEADLKNHDQQIAQAEEVEEFLKAKFTNQQLYSWMLSRLSSLYFQAYQMALQFARQAEQTYRYELGPEESSASFVTSLYWDSLKKGLLAGEQLHQDLRRMEQAYLEANRRQLEISKHISLSQFDPAALLALRETGSCQIHVPEVLFDMDFPGHYFRRIRTARLTIPCVAGPYTNISATLSLDQSWTRKNTLLGDTNQPELDAMMPPQDAIATSTANQDGGVFELTFNDQRYLPFEGAGVISEWKLQLNNPLLAQFDYDSISDVILHINYTARDGGQVFRSQIENALLQSIEDYFGNGQALQQLISIKQTQSDDWALLGNLAGDDVYLLTVDLGLDNFPFYLKNRGVTIKTINLALNCDISVAGWDTVSLPEMTDSLGHQPYEAAFVDNVLQGLPSTEFILNISVDVGVKTLNITLPKQLVAAIGSDVRDIYVIYSYEINKFN